MSPSILFTILMDGSPSAAPKNEWAAIFDTTSIKFLVKKRIKTKILYEKSRIFKFFMLR